MIAHVRCWLSIRLPAPFHPPGRSFAPSFPRRFLISAVGEPGHAARVWPTLPFDGWNRGFPEAPLSGCRFSVGRFRSGSITAPRQRQEHQHDDLHGTEGWYAVCGGSTGFLRARPTLELPSLALESGAIEPATQVVLQGEPGPLERRVLLVEDSPADARLVREALTSDRHALTLVVARDGCEALDLLEERERKPDLILLDLNLPAMDGRALLRRIKSDSALLRIPVVVLTSSSAEQDVWVAYGLHANCYLVKPRAFGSLERALHQTIEFWIEVARLPGH